jgi:5-methylcytosine-specific restriction endonuclease McrA
VTRAEYRARPGRSSKWISPVRRLAIYLRDSFACQYCGRDLREAKPSEVHLDHLRPRSAGGGDGERNLVTACRSCNCARKEMPWTAYAPAGARERTRRRTLNLPLARALLAGRTGSSNS